MSVDFKHDRLQKPQAVIFDWDGTLVDTHPVLAAAMNSTLEHYGREPWTYEEWQAWLGLSAKDAFPKEFGDRWQDARTFYLGAYEKLFRDQIKALPGASSVLKALAVSNIPSVIVSNKTGKFLRAEINHFEWDHFFVSAIGSGDSAQDKPAADPVHDALKPLSLDTGPGIWFVGDNDVDVACGRATQCTTVLVGDAYPDSNPDHRVADLQALGSLIGLPL